MLELIRKIKSYAITTHFQLFSRYLKIIEPIVLSSSIPKEGNDLREIALLLALFVLISIAAADEEEKRETIRGK